MPHQALLPSSWRSCAGHWPLAHDHRGWPGADAGDAWTAVGPLSAHLCARHSGRLWQVAHWSELFDANTDEHRRGAICRRGFQRPSTRLPAGAATPLTGGAAPHLAGVSTPKVVEHRSETVAVPVAGHEADGLARGPAETGRRHSGKSNPVDDEDAAVGRLHDFDDMAFPGKVPAVTVMQRPPVGCLVCEYLLADREGEPERQRYPQHHALPPSQPRRIETIRGTAKSGAQTCSADRRGNGTRISRPVVGAAIIGRRASAIE